MSSKPARVTVRMSPQLHKALASSAERSGCSLNAFIVEVLAASAGHAARYRGLTEADRTPDEDAVELREIPRRESGVPYGRERRNEHNHARGRWLSKMQSTGDFAAAARLAEQHDREDPWFYVEWWRERTRDGATPG